MRRKSIPLLNESGEQICVAELPGRPFVGDVLYVNGIYYEVRLVVLLHDATEISYEQLRYPVQVVVSPRAWTRKPLNLDVEGG